MNNYSVFYEYFMNFSTQSKGVLKCNENKNRHTQYGGFHCILFTFFIQRLMLNQNISHQRQSAHRNGNAGVDNCAVIGI